MKGVAVVKRRGHTLTTGQMVALVDHNPQLHVDLPLLIQESLSHARALRPDQCIGKIVQDAFREVKIQGSPVIENLNKEGPSLRFSNGLSFDGLPRPGIGDHNQIMKVTINL
jgi:hypothetical protein